MGKSKKKNNLGYTLNKKSLESLWKYASVYPKGSSGFLKTLRQFSPVSSEYKEPERTIKEIKSSSSSTKLPPVVSVSKELETTIYKVELSDFNKLESSFEITPKEKPIDEIPILSYHDIDEVLTLPCIPAKQWSSFQIVEKEVIPEFVWNGELENNSVGVTFLTEEYFNSNVIINESNTECLFDFFQNHTPQSKFCEKYSRIENGISASQGQWREMSLIYANQKERPDT